MSPISPAVKWTICAVAALGFLVDIYAILVAPLILQPALVELGHLRPGTPDYRDWAAYLFWIPPLAGGFFGLIGGYLTDRIGRRNILIWTILIYVVSATSAGYSTTLPWLLFWRTLSFIDACVEFVASVAWLAELFTEPKMRERVLGWTQAFSSLGGVLVSQASYLSNHYGASLPPIYGGHAAWRYTLISAVIPAIPLVLLRPFLPESPEWKRKKDAGTLKRPHFSELFQPAYRRTTIVTSLLFACAYGAAFGAIQQAPQITPGLQEVVRMAPQLRGETVAKVQQMQEWGGLVGRIALALLAVVIVSRRALLRVFVLPGLFIVPFVFFYPATHSLELLRYGMFFAGICTVAQLSFWGNYLPRVYPLHLRGTGEGFSANVGGRMLGTSAAYVTTHLAGAMGGATPSVKLAYAASAVALFVYALALGLTFLLPEPPKVLED
jgi:predicted MFS family arabinose efflux permease